MPQVVKKNSIGGRFFSSFGSILMGIVLIIGCIVGMFWNESRNVKMINALDDVAKVVIEVSSTEVKAENDGKLVAVSGDLTFSTAAVDNIFGVTSTSFVLVRNVEVYQWQQTQSGSSTDAQITYDYEKIWTTVNIDSSGFYDKSYSNPAWPSGVAFSSTENFSDDAKLGAFSLSSTQLNDLPANVGVEVPNDVVLPSTGYTISQDKNYVTNSANLSNPEVGDVRISFKQSDVNKASVLAKQQGFTLVDFTTKNDTKINRIFEGVLTAQQMIDYLEAENSSLTWILRFVFVIFECVGFAMLFSPIKVLTSIIPLLGNFLGKLTKTIIGLIALLLGVSVSLVVIAVSWIVVRPIIAIPLLVVAVILIVLLVKASKNKKAQTAEA